MSKAKALEAADLCAAAIRYAKVVGGDGAVPTEATERARNVAEGKLAMLIIEWAGEHGITAPQVLASLGRIIATWANRAERGPR